MISLIKKTCFLTALLIIAMGCSSSQSPVTVSETPSEGMRLHDSDAPIDVLVTDISDSGSIASGYGALGVYSVSVDSDSLTGEMTPLRGGLSADVLEVVDITNFMRLAPCSDCARLMSVELDDDDNVILKIGIKHPFDEGDPYKPITGRNRGDLHVFNIEGLVVTDGTGVTQFPGLAVAAGSPILLNANGYSSYLANSLDAIFPTQSNVHPYILHFDDYSSGNYDPNNPMGFESVTIPHPSGNLVMAMGSDYDVKDYVFNVDGNFEFIYAIGCTYAISAETKMQRFDPVFRIPQHNKKAASEVWVEITNNELKGEDATSNADLEIYVVDVNHGVPVGDALNEMRADSSVGDVLVEVPGVTVGSVSFGNTPSAGTGHDPSDPLVFNGTITNQAEGSEGIYTGLVKVVDTYPTGLNQFPLLGGQDGIERVDPVINPIEGVFAIPEFATYSVFQIEVAISGELIAVIESNPEPPDALTCQYIHFDGSNSYDDFGYNIVEYQWNWDYTGNPEEFVIDRITTEPFVKYQYTTEGLHRTALRVLNDAPTPITSEPAYLEHTLIQKLPEEYNVREVNKVSDFDDRNFEIWMPGSNAIAVDSNDVVHILGKVGSEVHYFKWDDGLVTSEVIGEITSYAHQSIEVDSNDTVHAVWYRPDRAMVHSENSDGTWTEPEILASDNDFENDRSPYSYSLGVNGRDELMVIWQELFTDNEYMKYVMRDETGWRPLEIIQSTDVKTGQEHSRLAVMVVCNGTPGYDGENFHALWTEQYNTGYMNPCVRYAQFDRETETWSEPEWVAPHYTRYQDWSDMTVTSDGAVVVGSSITWRNAFAAYRDPETEDWTTWMVTSSSHDEYTSTIGANADGTIAIAYWERVGYPDPDPFKIMYKVFHKDMTQSEVSGITPELLDPTTEYEYRYCDMYTKECSFYVLFMDRRDTLGDRWNAYFARISP